MSGPEKSEIPQMPEAAQSTLGTKRKKSGLTVRGVMLLIILLLAGSLVHGKCNPLLGELPLSLYVILVLPCVPTIMFGDALFWPDERVTYWIHSERVAESNIGFAAVSFVVCIVTLLAMRRATTRRSDSYLLLAFWAYLVLMTWVLAWIGVSGLQGAKFR